jgi:predicted phosphodiesterase
VHGSPRKVNEYLLEDRPASSFERIAALADCDVLVFGHTHTHTHTSPGCASTGASSS